MRRVPLINRIISFWLLAIVFLVGSMALGYVAHAASIDCSAKKAQSLPAGFGHPEVCIEIPQRMRSRAVVTSEVCEDGYGCHPIDADGNIDRSKWWMSEPTGVAI